MLMITRFPCHTEESHSFITGYTIKLMWVISFECWKSTHIRCDLWAIRNPRVGWIILHQYVEGFRFKAKESFQKVSIHHWNITYCLKGWRKWPFVDIVHRFLLTRNNSLIFEWALLKFYCRHVLWDGLHPHKLGELHGFHRTRTSVKSWYILSLSTLLW